MLSQKALSPGRVELVGIAWCLLAASSVRLSIGGCQNAKG
jgi:hypothetical protein